MTTERRILKALGDAELSGEQITKQGDFWFMPCASLLRMERQKLIVSRWIDGDYPRQRVYKRTL